MNELKLCASLNRFVSRQPFPRLSWILHWSRTLALDTIVISSRSFEQVWLEQIENLRQYSYFFLNQYNHINKRGPVSVLSHICYFNFIITSVRQFTGILVWLAHDKQVFFGNISPDNRRLPRKHEMWSHYREIKIVYKLFRLNNLLLQLDLFSWNRFKQRKTKSLDVQFYAVIV